MNTESAKKRVVLAVTGASGLIYAGVLARELGSREDVELHLILSDAAREVMRHEDGLDEATLRAVGRTIYSERDIAAPPASGSWRHQGMIVCPCSMASLAAIAQGLGSNLIHRAADVALKEGMKLVLVPREMPLSTIHLRNMLAAREAGAVILPACPGFYHRPATIQDLAAHVAGKILDQLDIPHGLFGRWGE
ncbi:UbiX family flavin prenyltransferase [Desulfovibrio aminophilus]|nr:UbiX family flavin prenyltransferase [Desulfovibrio aminophilus]MCM0754174.1 UbiX family flavin prenyltransferase [Desulfovibrio aminophilus]